MTHERKTLTTNRELVFGALALALSIIFLGLSYVIPFASLLTIVFIPFLIAIFAFNSSAKSKTIFMIALTVVCLIDIQEGFFYLWPNAVIGLVYGSLLKHKCDRVLLFLVTSAVSFLLSYGVIFPINYLFKTNLFEVFAHLFGLETTIFQDLVAPVFFMLIGLVETLIMHLTVSEEMKKFKMEINDSKHQFLILTILNSVLFVLALGLSFVSLSISYVILAYSLVTSSLISVYIIQVPGSLNKTVFGILFIVSLFVALGLTSVFKAEKLALIFLSPVAFVSLSSLLFIIYIKVIRNVEIGNSLFPNNNDIIQ